MSKTFDIKIKKLKYVETSGFQSSQLVLELSGSDINVIVANTLRRVAMDNIPVYAFAYINIEHNNSIYNNDMMRIRLRQLPIYDISNQEFYLHPMFWENVDYNDKDRDRNHEATSIEAIINVYNNSNENINVTTNDISLYIDNDLTQYKPRNKDQPILIIQLRPNETFKCQLRGCLGVGERDNIWSAAQVYYDEQGGKIIFTIESFNQMTEFDVLEKACQYIKYKLELIKTDIKMRVDQKEIIPNQTIIIDILGEDHTICNLINDILQNNKKVLFSGISKPDHLIREMKFKISTIDPKISPIEPFFESIDYLDKLMDNLLVQFTKLK